MVHGEPDCDEDTRLICEVLPTPAEQAGPRLSAKAAAAFEAEVRALARPWWRIVPSLYAR
ncbi:hypothetical protein ACFYUK_45420 [Nonomuraea wenchangensis]